MKIREAKSIYSSQLDVLRNRKQELTKILKEGSNNYTDNPQYDRVVLSQELAQIEEQYEETRDFMEELTMREMVIHNGEVAKQQGEAMAKAAEDMVRCMEIARRISSGGKVPPTDEQKLMEYSHDLYMAAKNMAIMNAQKKHKEYDTLLDDEEDDSKDTRDANEIANDSEVNIEMPEIVSEGGTLETE